MAHECKTGCGCSSPLVDLLIEQVGKKITRRDFIKYSGAAAGMLATGNAAWAASEKDQVADTIYHNGPIVTMVKDGHRVEALAVKAGKILNVGSKSDVMAAKGPQTKVVDLKGHCLMPGFIDPHSHVVLQSVKFATVNLDPKPIGEVGSIADIQRLMRERIEKEKIEPGKWVIGWGYDDTGIKEMRHPTREDLDAVSTEHPIMMMHISAHLLAGNSLMLEEIGVGPDTPDPEGGVIRRMADGKTPNGVLEELAMTLVVKKLPVPTPEQAMVILKKGFEFYAEAGITTAQEGSAFPGAEKLLAAMAAQDMLPIDIVTYPLYKACDDAFLEAIVADRTATGRFRRGGLKMTVDGSIQGYTAFLSKPYYVQPGNTEPTADHCNSDRAERIFVSEEIPTPVKNEPPKPKEGEYRGYANMTLEEVTDWLRRCDEKGVQVHVHTNGDGATDMLIEAVKAVRKDSPRPELRTTIIHAQTMREDQLDFSAKHGLVPSFFSIHVTFWGDRHRDIFLGPDRAARISPAKSALNRNMKFTLHHDAPVAGISMLAVASASVNRMTTGGNELGPEQRITAFEALRAITADAAWQYFEEDRKGTLETGKLADLVILSGDPLAVDPMKMADIKVLETIKDGKMVFSAKS
jgi:predicted amidohydrolase YtcJ